MSASTCAKRALPAQSVPGNEHMAFFQGRTIDIYRLIHLLGDAPVQDVAVSDISDQLTDMRWTDDFGKISPEFVIIILRDEGFERAAARYPSLSKHIEKIRTADLSSPLIIYQGWLVIDGMHRLSRAVLEGKTALTAIFIDEIPNEALVKR